MPASRKMRPFAGRASHTLRWRSLVLPGDAAWLALGTPARPSDIGDARTAVASGQSSLPARELYPDALSPRKRQLRRQGYGSFKSRSRRDGCDFSQSYFYRPHPSSFDRQPLKSTAMRRRTQCARARRADSHKTTRDVPETDVNTSAGEYCILNAENLSRIAVETSTRQVQHPYHSSLCSR